MTPEAWLTLAGLTITAVVPALIVWASTRRKHRADTAATLIERQEAMFRQMSEFDETRVAYWRERFEDCAGMHSRCEEQLAAMEAELAELRSQS